jgi:hypothetical protein
MPPACYVHCVCLPAAAQVEVLALPYYRRGVLVDMRCLLLQQGRLMGSWLAVGARELYMQRELQVRLCHAFFHVHLPKLWSSVCTVVATR